MTQQTQQKIEQQFGELRNSISPEQWCDPVFLFNKAKALETLDLAFARRIMQRIKNLKPDNPDYVDELANMGRKLMQQQSDSVTSGTVECQNTEHKSNQNPDIQPPDNQNNSSQKLTLVKTRLTNKLQHPKVAPLTRPIFLFVILPFLLFAFYQIIWASPRYESRSQLIVQQPDGMATMDASMALLTGLGVSSSGTADTELVKAYIYSEDMLNYLDQQLGLRQHYSDTNIDFFSRLHDWDSREDFISFYLDHLNIEIDDSSGVIKILAQAFLADYANTLNQTLVQRAEWFINSVGHQLAEAQLEFIKKEHINIEQKLKQAKSQLLAFQQQNDLLDPEAEGMAFQQITYTLEGSLATKRAELKALRLTMSDVAPQVMFLSSQVDALKTQLNIERNRLSLQDAPATIKQLSISQILAKYSEFKIEMELALQAYTSSQVSLEKSRIEAYRQLKYLIVVEGSTLPDDNQYPTITYNLVLFAALLLMLFGIAKIIIATVRELK